MSSEGQVEKLLARYIEHRLAGKEPPSATELCRDSPQLRAPLQAEIDRYEAISEDLPETAVGSPTPGGSRLSSRLLTARDLPFVPPDGAAKPSLEPGAILGGRYQIRSLLGRGGTGEVWLASDLKLRVEVALKALLPGLFASDDLRELLRREVRLARQVISPHVCRVYDLAVEDGHELLSMEYVDGQTLRELLAETGPLGLREATEVATQFLAGLAGIHDAGLVHRDLKPDNLMITRSGRVVIMDLGLAKAVASDGETVAGTPAYMSPEQLEGRTVDTRSDLFTAALVLAELLGGERRRAVLAGARKDPPRIPDSPWKAVLERALAIDPAKRYATAEELARALEEVNLRAEGAEEQHPYPGLDAFTESDAEYFHGREIEIEQLWRKLANGHLLAVVGPSGAGKSSFLQAGLLPARPKGWSSVICRPGDAPFVSLAQALVPELSADTEAMRGLLRMEDLARALEVVARWREQHAEALLVVDQFEELFTLNPPEVEARFAGLLGRLAIEADVHVLLAMRDDFLFRCHAHPALAPILSELTLLGPPTGAALRRALVQPAAACGYRFEDDGLIEEMLAAVAGERGALPLLAFAAARLWELRDRQSGLLTRSAYEEIGGVTGALAGHAEATLKRIGSERQGTVREIFRNLATAEGTRVTRERHALLSVFEDREAAGEVLEQLVAARLLTSYDVEPGEAAGSEPSRRVEIVHESLLEAWPRLVRWRTQDADSAQLRDQLRQAARVWEERDRSEDLLWSGTPFREYRVWRERYPGGLTTEEEAFAAAMERKAFRERRRRRLVAVSAFVVLLAVLTTVGLLWRRAADEARRAEAAQLLALGRLELDGYPTAALAYALASLELADEESTRQLALEALGRGPPAILVEGRAVQNAPSAIDWSADERWLAVGFYDGSVRLWERSGGSPRILEPAHRGTVRDLQFSADSSRLMSAGFADGTVRLWSVADGEPLETVQAERGWLTAGPASGGRLITAVAEEGMPAAAARMRIESRSLDGDEGSLLGFIPGALAAIDLTDRWLAHADPAGRLWVVPLDQLATWPGRLVGRHEGGPPAIRFHPDGAHLFSAAGTGELRRWSLDSSSTQPDLELRGRGHEGAVVDVAVHPRGVELATSSFDQTVRVWELEGPADADPVPLRRGEVIRTSESEFHPGGRWLATADGGGTALWRLDQPRPRILRGHSGTVWGLVFAADGSWLASASADGTLRLWPLRPDAADRGGVLLRAAPLLSLAASPDGDRLVAGSNDGQVYVVAMPGSVDGEGERVLSGFEQQVRAVAFDPRGGRVAAGGGGPNPRDHVIRIWDLETGETRLLDPGDGEFRLALEFTPDGQLLSAGPGGVRLWNLEDGTHELLWSGEGLLYKAYLSADGRQLLIGGADMERRREGEFLLLDLDTRRSTPLVAPGPQASSGALSGSAGTVVIGGWDGLLRVVPTASDVAHYLFGHRGTVFAAAVSADERWIATGDDEGIIRLWPMPEGRPLHTLSYRDLLDHLRRLTNLRVVEDRESRTGYRLDAEPFPGWEE